MKSSAIAKIIYPVLMYALLPCAQAAQDLTTRTPPPGVLEKDSAQQVYIFGTVMEEDGTPPPTGGTIELDCRGSVTKKASIEANGYFGFKLGEGSRVGQGLPDASEETPGTFGRSSDRSGYAFESASSIPAISNSASFNPKLMGCSVRAALNGYTSSAIKMDGVSLSALTNIGTILLFPKDKVMGTTVSATSGLAPRQAKKAAEEATKALQKNNFTKSEELLKSAVALYPKYAEAWYQLGKIYRAQHRSQEARDAYTKAMGCDDLYINPRLGLAWISAEERKWEETAQLTDLVLNLDPLSFPDAYFLSAVANYNLKHMALAEKSAIRAERLDSEHKYPKIYLILASICTNKNDNDGAMGQLRNYLKYAPDAPDAELVRKQLQEKEAAGTGESHK